MLNFSSYLKICLLGFTIFVFTGFCSRWGQGREWTLIKHHLCVRYHENILMLLYFRAGIQLVSTGRLAGSLWPASVLVCWCPSPAIYTLLNISVLLLLYLIFKINLQGNRTLVAEGKDTVQGLNCLLPSLLPRSLFVCVSWGLELGEPDVHKHFLTWKCLDHEYEFF